MGKAPVVEQKPAKSAEMAGRIIGSRSTDPIVTLAPDLRAFMYGALSQIPEEKHEEAIATIREEILTGPMASQTRDWRRRIAEAVKSAASK